jgi:hypothetical protein
MSEVREHPWFKDIKWSEIGKRSLKAPIIPKNILRAKFLERNPSRRNPEEKEYMANPHFFIKQYTQLPVGGMQKLVATIVMEDTFKEVKNDKTVP